MPKTYCQQQAAEIAESLKRLVSQAERVGIDYGDYVFKDVAVQMEVIRHTLLDRAGA